MSVHNLLLLTKTFQFILDLGIRENYSNPFKGLETDGSRTAFILANGPSLNGLLKKIEATPDLYKKVDYFVVNDFACDSRFELIKPQYYVLSDPLFFLDTIYAERGHKTDEAIADKVYWPMVLFIPYKYRNSIYLNSIRQNKNVKIVHFHSIHYAGLDRWTNWFYKRGLGNGEYGTVALNQIYSALMLGYKQIELYGVDHTFFSNIVVNENNVLCTKSEHFFSQETELKPMRLHYYNDNPNRTYTMAEFLSEKAEIFRGHMVMNSFAKSLGAIIINKTSNSMIDAYPRG
jgi:hypothetical protein